MNTTPQITKTGHHSRIFHSAVAALSVIFFLCCTTASADVIWNAALDLVANESPNGPQELKNPNATIPLWSYGYRSTVSGSALTLFAGDDHSNTDAPYEGWTSHGQSFEVPYVRANVSGAPHQGGNPDELLLHPGNSGDRTFVVVRWIAPAAGTSAIVTDWRGDGQTSGNGVDVHLVVNGSTVFDQTIPAAGATSDSRSVTVSQGDTIDFVLGPNGNYAADGTFLRAVITVPTTGEVQAVIHPAVEIAWPSLLGALYQVQATPTLAPAAWTNLGTPVTGDGTEMSIYDKTRNRDKRFYRVIRVQ